MLIKQDVSEDGDNHAAGRFGFDLGYGFLNCQESPITVYQQLTCLLMMVL